MSKLPTLIHVPPITVKNICAHIEFAEGMWDERTYGAEALENRNRFHSMLKSATGSIKFHWEPCSVYDDLNIKHIEGVSSEYKHAYTHSTRTGGSAKSLPWNHQDEFPDYIAQKQGFIEVLSATQVKEIQSAILAFEAKSKVTPAPQLNEVVNQELSKLKSTYKISDKDWKKLLTSEVKKLGTPDR